MRLYQKNDPNNGPIYVSTKQGGKKIGLLKNNILHMDRDYEKHHYRKTPGWCFDKQTFDDNSHRIRAFVLHCKNYPITKDEKRDVILTLDLEEHGLRPHNMQTIDWGHNRQYLVPDRYWHVEVVSQSTPGELSQMDSDSTVKSGIPFALDELEVEEPKKELPKMKDIEILTTMPTEVHQEAAVSERPSTALFAWATAKAFLTIGSKVYIPAYGKGLYLTKQGNLYTIQSELSPELPGLLFVYQEWMDEESIFSLTP